jgi:hypothetical protein
VRPLRPPQRFARTINELQPANRLQGNQASSTDLKIAAGALESVGDVFARFIITFGIGSGLRGGQFTYLQQSYGYEFELDRVRWTDDLEVSGTLRWRTASGKLSSDVTLRQKGKDVGNLNFVWNDVEVNAIASISGVINGKPVKAQRLAP